MRFCFRQVLVLACALALSVPAICQTSGEITGSFTPQEVLDMVKQRRGEPMAQPAGEETEESPPAEEPEEVPAEGEQEGEAAAAATPTVPEHEEPLPEEWPASAKARAS
jgi:hypothetical protein